ncbi:MAG TPA: hypothetical protein PLO62_08890 [Candidatus Hydrogenedentes bacterium]|nr:hypothetical protein [Candidatus Hydrogenedentota bacterium]HOS03624.1 hypothetical protein [Candidatus Hydrogenedentota bacterium]
MKLLIAFVVVLFVGAAMLFTGSNAVWAQDERPRMDRERDGNSPGGGRRGNADPAQMTERMMNRMKEGMEATDEEWQVIAPRLRKVMELQPMPRFGGMGPRQGRPAEAQGTATQGPAGGQARGSARGPFAGANVPEADALQKAIDSKESTNEELRQAMKAYRDARSKQEKELQRARQELRDVLTLRQEAQLMLMRLLD